mmetsp:Transcript_14441/g.16816  ORF Transcript_14441/g.16816 Transcript_14441/m.16816 type:complete len:559 (-) Transcript_14441:97-1773(-)
MTVKHQKQEVMENSRDMDDTDDEEVKRNCFDKLPSMSSCDSEEDGYEDDSLLGSCNEYTAGKKDCSDRSYSSRNDGTVATTETESVVSNNADADYTLDEEDSSSPSRPANFTFDLSKCKPEVELVRPKPISLKKVQEMFSDEETGDGYSIDDDEYDESSMASSAPQNSCEDEESDEDNDSDDDENSQSDSSNNIEDHDEEEDACIEETMSCSSQDTYDDQKSQVTSMTNHSADFNQDLNEEEGQAQDYDDISSEYDSDEESDDDEQVDCPNDDEDMDEDNEKDISFNDNHIASNLEVEIERSDKVIQIVEKDEGEAIVVSSSSGDEASSISAGEVERILECGEDSTETLISNINENDDQETPANENRTEQTLTFSAPLKRKLNQAFDVHTISQCNSKNLRVELSESEDTKATMLIRAPFMPSLRSCLNSTLMTKVDLSQRTLHDDLTSSDIDHEVDTQLAEELLCVSPTSIDVEPIPLLTPPDSPVLIYSEGGEVEICEWPSNLAVDNALTASIELRPLSPYSLAKLEENDIMKEPFMSAYPRKRSVTRDFTSHMGEN